MAGSESLSRDHIWCVIPVYNNRDTVEAVARECCAHLAHVVVVDDGSADTDTEALFAGSEIVVLKHEQNLGKGAAILTALRYVAAQRGRFMITIDGDGQHYPRDIERFVPLLQDDEQDDETAIVIGCRRFRGENVPEGSRFGRKFGNFWLWVEAGASIADSQSGFRAYPVRYLSQLKLSGSRYDFEVEVLTRAVWAGLELKAVEVDVWYPEPKRRVSAFRPFVDNLRITRMHARLVARRLLPWPHRRLVTLGGSALQLGDLLHPVKLMSRLLTESATPGLLAASAAMGTFLGALPLIAVHTLVILYVATRLRLNKVMAVAIQNLCMPPFVPLLCIELGYHMRNGEWLTSISSEIVFEQAHERLFEWLLGSLIVAPAAAVLVGGIVFVATAVVQSRLVGQNNRASA